MEYTMIPYYRYVNRTGSPININGYYIEPYGEYRSETPVLVLDKLDGILVDLYVSGREKAVRVEYNSYNPVMSHFKGDGIKLNTEDPVFGWHDLVSPITIDTGAATGKPTFATLVGNIKKYQFKVGDSTYHSFHLPHDYLPGSDLYIHVHWTHNSQIVTGGSTTWSFEATYAKGYNQAQFNTPSTVSATQTVINTPLTHQIAEVQLSSVSGIGGKLDSNNIETDGLLFVRTNLTDSTIGVDPFMMFCDIHYQSTGRPTKNRNHDFWL